MLAWEVFHDEMLQPSADVFRLVACACIDLAVAVTPTHLVAANAGDSRAGVAASLLHAPVTPPSPVLRPHALSSLFEWNSLNDKVHSQLPALRPLACSRGNHVADSLGRAAVLAISRAADAQDGGGQLERAGVEQQAAARQLASRVEARELTSDHKPGRPDEQQVQRAR